MAEMSLWPIQFQHLLVLLHPNSIQKIPFQDMVEDWGNPGNFCEYVYDVRLCYLSNYRFFYRVEIATNKQTLHHDLIWY